MTKRLDIKPQQIAFGSVSTLLNGALSSLSGPVGFTLSQPTIHVKGIWVINPSTSSPVAFSLFKGASGGNAAGTQILSGNALVESTTFFEVDTELSSSDFLTGEATSSTSDGDLIINITADIDF